MDRTNLRSVRGGAARAGFTLLEVLIVVAILGLIATLIVTNLGGKAAKAKVDTAKIAIKNVATMVEQFNLDVGRYPTVIEGLKALIEKPQGVEGWSGPYNGKKSLDKDPWNHDYIYDWVKKDDKDSWYVIKSLGSDGKPGGEGDAADLDNRS